MNTDERNEPKGGTQPAVNDSARYRQDGDPARREQGDQGTQGNRSGQGQQGAAGDGRKDQGNNGQAMNDRGNSTQRGENGRTGE